MKLLDRITGQQVLSSQLSEPMLPGRYLLMQQTLINGHTPLEDGTVIMGDGSNRIKLDDRVFTSHETIEEECRKSYDLICQALFQIDKSINFDEEAYPSPLIPYQLLDSKGKLNDLEEQLEEVMEKGHLHEISQSPRFDMRYDDMVMPVSRAKRLANSAERHLASHSTCWQQRTFTGIHPRQVLGLVSEDEYHLYENRVFVRLLDRLLHYLNNRIWEVKNLIEELTKVLNLENSEDLIFLLSQKLCKNWGDTHTHTHTRTSDYIELLNKTKARLEALQRSIKGLTQGFLYRSLPRNVQIPSQIEQTNILSHDQHYRHLPPLWNELKNATQSDNQTQEDQLEVNLALQSAFSRYAGMLIMRALRQIGFQRINHSNEETAFERRDHKLSVTNSNMNWSIQDQFSEFTLSFVPIFSWNMTTNCQVQKSNRNIVIPVSIQNSGSTVHPVNYIAGSFREYLSLSPLDFYSEEKLISIISYWIMIKPLDIYGRVIEKFPTSLMPLLNNSEAFRVVDKYNASMVKIATKKEEEDILTQLKKENAQTIIKNNRRQYFFTNNTLSLSSMPV